MHLYSSFLKVEIMHNRRAKAVRRKLNEILATKTKELGDCNTCKTARYLSIFRRLRYKCSRLENLKTNAFFNHFFLHRWSQSEMKQNIPVRISPVDVFTWMFSRPLNNTLPVSCTLWSKPSSWITLTTSFKSTSLLWSPIHVLKIRNGCKTILKEKLIHIFIFPILVKSKRLACGVCF